MNSDAITVKKAAELANVTQHYIRQLLREGKISGEQDTETGRWTVNKPSLLQFRAADINSQGISGLAKEMRVTIKDAVEAVEEDFDCTVISYMSAPNTPVSMIDHNDCILLDDLLHSMKEGFPESTQGKKYKRVCLFLHSGGGILESAIKFVDIIRQYADEYHVIVPLMAKSAATYMVLEADKQYFTSLSELGPVDPIVQSPTRPDLRVPATAIEDFIEYWGKEVGPHQGNSSTDASSAPLDQLLRAKLNEAVDPYLLGSYKTALKFSREVIKGALEQHAMKGQSATQIEAAVDEFTKSHSSHGYPISYTTLARYHIGQKIEDESRLSSIKLLTTVYQQFMANSNIVKLIGNREENKNITLTPSQPTQQTPTRTSL